MKFVKVMFGNKGANFEYKVDEVLGEWNDFIFHRYKNDRLASNELVREIDECLKEIEKSEIIKKRTIIGQIILLNQNIKFKI